MASEQYVLAFVRAGIIEGVAMRYFNVFGPRQDPDSQYAAAIPLFLRAALEGTTATIFGDGRPTRDFTYVDNVVDANLLAARASADDASGAVVNVGAGTRTSLLELIALIGEVSKHPVKYEHRPPRSGDVRDSLASLERASRLLGYEPRVALAEGLRRTWDWLSTQRHASSAVNTPGLPTWKTNPAPCDPRNEWRGA